MRRGETPAVLVQPQHLPLLHGVRYVDRLTGSPHDDLLMADVLPRYPSVVYQERVEEDEHGGEQNSVDQERCERLLSHQPLALA